MFFRMGESLAKASQFAGGRKAGWILTLKTAKGNRAEINSAGAEVLNE